MSYYLTRQLPSCFVERKLLEELEAYVQRKASEFAYAKIDGTGLNYSFSIADSFGIERLKAVEDFKRSYFPDDTLFIKLKCEVYSNPSITIEIKFSLLKNSTTLDTWFDGNSAREVTSGIAAEINSILKSYKTSNHLFHSY